MLLIAMMLLVLVVAIFLCIPVSSLTRRRETGHKSSGLQT
jgi:competence protein ComGC